MTTSTAQGPAWTEPRTDAVERVVLLAGGDLAAYAAARWVARRAVQHPIELVLVAPDGDEPAAGRAERTAEALLGAPVGLQVRVLSPGVDGGGAVLGAAQHADLLVLGTKRVPALSRPLPHAAARRLAESVRCPVVLVPSDWEPKDAPVVLGVALDGSDRAALRFAVAEAMTLGRELVLQHAWHLSDVVTPVFAFALDETPMRAEHATRLAAFADRVRAEAPSVPVRTELVHGEAARVLPQRGLQAELIVVGSHGRSSLERVLLGSVGRALADQPPCPVAIVPPRYGRSTAEEAGR